MTLKRPFQKGYMLYHASAGAVRGNFLKVSPPKTPQNISYSEWGTCYSEWETCYSESDTCYSEWDTCYSE